MKRPTIRILIAAKETAAKLAKPKSRERLKRELRALEVARLMKNEVRRYGVAV